MSGSNNVVSMWGGGETPEDREQLVATLADAGRAAAGLRDAFAAIARTMDANLGHMAGQMALSRRRREWDAQHAEAVKGDQDAVVYLLHHPRP